MYWGLMEQEGRTPRSELTLSHPQGLGASQHLGMGAQRLFWSLGSWVIDTYPLGFV